MFSVFNILFCSGFAEKPSGNVIAIREPSFSTDDTYGESSESNSVYKLIYLYNTPKKYIIYYPFRDAIEMHNREGYLPVPSIIFVCSS